MLIIQFFLLAPLEIHVAKQDIQLHILHADPIYVSGLSDQYTLFCVCV